jgi:cytochrome P450
MIRVDSLMKETLRLYSSTESLAKEVVEPQGTRLEDGLYLPLGTRMSVASYGAHWDLSIYPTPMSMARSGSASCAKN